MLSNHFASRARRLIASLAGFTVLAASAQTYPARPVTLISSSPPGTAGDLIARAVAKGVTDGGNINMVVQNIDGASGHIAFTHTLNSAPDGYTLLLGSTTVVVNMYTQRVNYKITDFTPVGMVGTSSNTLITSLTLDAKSIPELVAAAKARPGQLMVATGGPTGVGTFLAEVLNSAAGIDMGVIPYKGSSLAIPDLLSGRIFSNIQEKVY